MSNTTPHIVSRIFNAPRELVWKANTEPERMARWFAPGDFESKVKTMDLRPGGICHYFQRSPDGKQEMWGIMTYEEVRPIDRLVFNQSFCDAEGNIIAHPISPTWPRVMHSVITFDDLGDDRTRITVEWTPHEATPEEIATFDAARGGIDQGWKAVWDKLDEFLLAEQA
jgi:uncharacterized protein YndB with AHSA1/START domain